MANMTSSASAAQVAAELSSASIDQIEALSIGIRRIRGRRFRRHANAP